MTMILGLATVILILADWLFKSYVEERFGEKEEKPAWKWFVLRKVHNRGACMNLLDDRPRLIRGLSLILTILLTAWQIITFRKSRSLCRKKGAALLTAGAWSNTLDRLIRGYVVDYISIKSRFKKVSAVTFNLADVFIAAGSILTVIFTGRGKKREKKDMGADK